MTRAAVRDSSFLGWQMFGGEQMSGDDPPLETLHVWRGGV